MENEKESITKPFPGCQVGSSSRICRTAGGVQESRQGWGGGMRAGGSQTGGSPPPHKSSKCSPAGLEEHGKLLGWSLLGFPRCLLGCLNPLWFLSSPAHEGLQTLHPSDLHRFNFQQWVMPRDYRAGSEQGTVTPDCGMGYKHSWDGSILSLPLVSPHLCFGMCTGMGEMPL